MRIKKIYTALLIVFFQLSFSQLPDFNLQVSAINETCPGNGTLSFTVSNTTAGASIVYNIFLLPNITTPIVTTSNSILTGLVSGSYKVVATQSLGVNTNSQQQNSTIVNQIVNLTFDLVGENEVCGNDGKITVNVTQGNAVSYEIFSGPMLRPLQISNVFTGLTAGLYQVRTFDSCGQGVVRSYVVSFIAPGLIITSPNNIEFLDCNNTVEHQFFGHSSSTDIAYPLLVECTVFPPGGGAPLVYNQTISGPNRSNNCYFYSQQMPLFAYQYYTYNIKATDKCGNIYTNNNIVVDSDITPMFFKAEHCNMFDVGYILASSATIISAPSNFSGTLPYDFSVNNFIANAYNLPSGFYTFSVTDICGNVKIENKILTPTDYPFFNYLEGCEVGMSQIISFGTSLQTITITSAPSTYQNTIPNDVTSYLDSSGHFFMNLPGGNYTFQVLDVCGNTTTHTVSTQGYNEITNFELIKHCDSFDFDFSHTSNYTGGNVYFWLQKKDPLTGQWEHPVTGMVYPPNSSPNIINSMLINNNSITTNIVGTGSYRIVKSDDRQGAFFCTRIIKKFGYSTEPEINNFYSFACPNGSYEVIVDAVGLGPLIYRITEKNGVPFVIDNGILSLFTGLSPAIYNFQVEDACGNILNRLYDLNASINLLPISLSDLCGGQNGSLSVPYFSFLHYEWWKGNDTSTILSTSNSLQFTPFSIPNDFGSYHVRVTNPSNSNSCINLVLDYEISPNLTNPNAGNDSTVSYCGSQGTINLFSLLTGSYTLDGTWEEITNSSTLNNNLWNSSGVAFGTYSFKYKVNGLCSDFDESQVDITINEIPAAPVASIDPVVCMSGDLNLYASTILGVTYQWTGPNGFSSALQNPILTNISSLNNGVYTVKTINQGCESGLSSVSVVIESLPEFYITETCENNIKTLTAIPLNGTFDSTINFNWTGPNGFVSLLNPIQIESGNVGAYSLTIDKNNCDTSKDIVVSSTACEIPKGISPNGDGLNDYFDLSGFDIKTIKIYNRYGLEIYSKDGYLNEWYGQADNGNILPDATYFYALKLNSGESKTGWVYLIR